MAKGPDSEEARQRLALIQRLWDELKAARHDPEKYYALIERIRREADAFRKLIDPDDPKSLKGVLHNPHSFEVMGSSSSTIFNIALAEKDSKLDKPAIMRKQGSMLRLQCDQHEFMQSFFWPVSNPHYAVAGNDGSFEIKDVPAGKHKLAVWHPFAGKGKAVEVEVDVPEGGKATVTAQIK